MNKVLAQMKSLVAATLVVTCTSIAASSAVQAQQDYKAPQNAVDALVAIARICFALGVSVCWPRIGASGYYNVFNQPGHRTGGCGRGSRRLSL
jgi:hypothetical protein